MRKFCPDPNCPFHTHYKRGIIDADYCNKCGKELVLEKPAKPIQTIVITEDHKCEKVIEVINPKENRYFKIHFNSLLSSEHWDQIDKVCLRIGHIYFRNYEVCIVTFKQVNKVTIQDEDYIHICGTLNFPVAHIEGNRIYFPYRYYLFMNDGGTCYEKMRHPTGIEYNRLFDIRIEEQINPGYVEQEYHHCDILILPGGCNCVSFVPIPYRRYLSLLTLLPCYFNKEEMNPEMLIEDFISEFKKIVKMINEFGLQDLRNIPNRDRLWSSSQVILEDEIELIEKWLLHSEILGLHFHILNVEYLLYQIYLACYLINIYQTRNDQLIEKLVLYIEKYIDDILSIPKNILEDMIITESMNFKVKIEDSIEKFIFDSVMLNVKYQDKVVILLPFFHKIRPTLTQSQVNYSEFTNSEYWGFPENCTAYWQDEIELFTIKSAMTRAQHDEILPYSILLYTLNERNIQDLYVLLTSANLHDGRLSLFMKLLIFRLHVAKKNDICISQDNKLRYNVITFLDATLSEEVDPLDSQDIDSLNKLTVQLITEELPLQFIDRDLFLSVLKLLSHGLTIITSSSFQVPLFDPTSLFKNFFKPWYDTHILSALVDNVLVQKDLENEIKFIDDVLLHITFLPIFQWDNLINCFLENRFKRDKVGHQNIVDLFLFLHDGKRHSEKLQDLIHNILIERIQSANSLERQIIFENFSDLTKVSSFEKVREILSKILLVENELFLNSTIPIEHFVSWTSWINYFQFLNSNDIDIYLSKNAQSALVSASERFLILINSMKELQFSTSEIQRICKNEDQFLKLVNLITTKLPPNGISGIRASLQKIKDAIKRVIYQTTELRDLSQLLNKCQSIDNGFINEFLSQNIKETPIIDLCDFDGNTFTFKKCFDISKIFNFSHFSQMMKLIHLLKNSEIFAHILEKQLKMIGRPIIKFDIELLYNEAWLPALKDSAQLIDKFVQQNILISEVYELFTDLSDQNKIISELKILNSGCSTLKTSLQRSELQFKKCAHAICRLHQFEKWDCVQAAEMILKFKDAFLMKCNFSVIETLTENTKDFFRNKSLIEITEHIVNTVESLEYLKDNGLDIIREFLKYNKFIQWIKEKMKNLNEIKTFVDISLSTHGNDSIDYDKITSFSSVCNNFSPLIFKISAETSCDILVANCKEVVENIKMNKNLILIEQLKLVGNNIEYWEDMMKCQSSVEESTIMQLNSIMKSGEFSLSLKDSLELSKVLTLTAEKGKNDKRFYNLDQLSELRSKLTLVVSKVEDKEIDCYENSQDFILLLDTLTEMASILIKLVQSGEQSSLKYDFTCSCGGKRDQLDIMCSELYELSESWKQNIENARKDHYFLNYFTISQIVLLQKGISSFLSNEECNDSEQLYHLLRLLNSNISKELINEALIKSNINKQNFHDFSQLGYLLENIKQSSKIKISMERDFPNNFVIGKPNLVTISSARIFEYVLSLYKDKDGNMPLPRYHEVLICSSQTSLEEINIFWLRALNTSKCPYDSHLYCLMNIEKLQYDVAMQAVSKFWIYQQESEINNVCYKLVLVCTEEEEELSYLATAFDDFKQIILSEFDVEDIKLYLNQKFTLKQTNKVLPHFPAWMVDKDRSKVRMVVSESVGAGKSLYIANLQSDPSIKASKRVVIHGKRAKEGKLTTDLLSKSLKFKQGYLFHVDIASTVHLGLEPLFFKLLILGAICNSNGELWHCRAEDYYVIEITLNSKFMSLVKFVHLYPTIECIQPFESLKITTESKGMKTWDLKEMKTDEFLRVYGYLNQLMIGNNFDIFIFLPKNYINVSHIDILSAIFKYCGILKPSWREVRNFVLFLNKQLLDCDESDYCDLESTERGWKGFKLFVVKFMIHMSKDFATPSLDINPRTDTDYLTTFQILERRRWEKNPHPYIFFNQDRHTMTFLGFHITKDGHLTDSEDCNTILEKDIMVPQLFEILTLNRVDLLESYDHLSKNDKIMKIANVLGINPSSDIDPDPGYVLTLDNVKKIIGILMRFRCNIPVVIMGETGCGKTRLVQFMCDLQRHHSGAKNMLILKIHGATTEKDVVNKVKEAEKLAVENSLRKLKLDTVLFFDEANTSSSISLIKEIMCDRRMYGEEIRSDIGLQFVAACNPYRKHSKEMLNKLNSAGLGFFTKNDRITDRLGDIPLRELVYRVMELPDSMRPLVWDFGQLSSGIEKMYICEIVSKQLRDSNCHIHSSKNVIDVLTEVMVCAQDYMRNKKDECSFVSLRDVERAMKVLVWFYSKIDLFQASQDVFKRKSHLEPQLSDNIDLKPPRTRISGCYDSEENDIIHLPETIYHNDSRLEMARSESIEESCPNEYPWSLTGVPVTRETINNIDYITYSLILSLAVCYRARLQERDTFDIQIADIIKAPLTPLRDYRVISREIDRCQKLILDEMSIDKSIVKNEALKENVFMMLVCIQLKIPLFVVGKPGSSKSLAKSIISNTLMGGNCPKSSILHNFKEVQLISYQCNQLSTADGIINVFQSCINIQRKTGSKKFIACVVLDEVGLAEDSPLLPLKVLHSLLEGSSFCAEHDEVPIESNDIENQVAFIGISNWSLDPAKMNRGIMVMRADPDIGELEYSAIEICRSKSSGNSGITSIENNIRKLAEAYQRLTKQEILNVGENIREYYGLRDFYGLIKMLVFLCENRNSELNSAILKHAVRRNFGGISNVDPVTIFLESVHFENEDNVDQDPSLLELIKANLASMSFSFYGQTRYLLLITENFSALNIILQSPDMCPKDQEKNMRVIFGSSFPNDKDYSAVCSSINDIKSSMETGKTIILLNLESLYEGLYDALNQSYSIFNNQRYVDLGLGTHRMKCRVHDTFKLIVIADRETVRNKFPTPLINRLEKHYITMSKILPEKAVRISNQLSEWARKFSSLDKQIPNGSQKDYLFNERDCFIGFNDETTSSIVFDVIKSKYPEWTAQCNIEINTKAVLEESKILLLKMTSIDAIFRLKNSLLSKGSDDIVSQYFGLHLDSLEGYLRRSLLNICDKKRKHLTLATTHSRLLIDLDINQLKENLKDKVNDIQCFSLHQFQTEQQFCRELSRFLEGRGERDLQTNKKILLIQCVKGVGSAHLIACARYKCFEKLNDWFQKSDSKICICLVFLIKVSRGSQKNRFVSFCGGHWDTIHIDDICSFYREELPSMSEMNKQNLYEIFSIRNSRPENLRSADSFQLSKLKHCLQSAGSRLDDSKGGEERTITRIHDLSNLMKDVKFLEKLCNRLRTLLREQYENSSDTDCGWLQKIANCQEIIKSCGTFRKAVNLSISKIITPLFSELIAFLDRDGNLMLGITPKDIPNCITNLWHNIFNDEGLLVLNYKDIVSLETMVPRTRVPVLNDGVCGNFYQASFPFSWMINQMTSDLFKETTQMNENHELYLTTVERHKRSQNLRDSSPSYFWMQFEEIFNETYLGKHIKVTIMGNSEEQKNLRCYLNDFIYMNMDARNHFEFMVFEYLLLKYIDDLPKSAEITNISPTILTIPKIQVVFEYSKDLTRLMQQAFNLRKELGKNIWNTILKLKKTKSKDLNNLEFVLVEEICSICSHKNELIKKEELSEKYVSQIGQFNILVEKALSLNFERQDYMKDQQLRLTNKWNRIKVIQLFISTCVLGFELKMKEKTVHKMIQNIEECTEFSSVRVICVLEILSKNLKSIEKGTIREKYKIQATRFFINILVDVTFKSPANLKLNSDLVIQLLSYVKFDKKRTDLMIEQGSINLFQKDGIDPSPAFGIFLLQLLIKRRKEVIGKPIDKLLREIQIFPDPKVMKNILLIIVSSIEDSLHRQFIEVDTFNDRIKLVQKYLKDVPSQIPKKPKISYELLDCIATLRSLSICISPWIIQYYELRTQNQIDLDQTFKQEIRALIDEFKGICLKQGFDELRTFLLKTFYNDLREDLKHDILNKTHECYWIFESIIDINEILVIPDYFLIYGEAYIQVQSIFKSVCSTQKKDTAQQYFKNENELSKQEMECLLYSFFQIAIETFTIPEQGKTLEEKFDPLRDFLTDIYNTDTDLLELAVQISSNNLGRGILTSLILSTTSNRNNILLVRLIYHVAIMVLSKNYSKLFPPIAMIYQDPLSLKDKLFPTMMVIDVPEIYGTGNWYKCPNGHPYFIGNCGRPYSVSKCFDCGKTIGGYSHRLEADNTLLEKSQYSKLVKSGYILGMPTDFCPNGERSLSPAALKVLRALIHSTFIWLTCSKQCTRENISYLVNSELSTSTDLPRIFYQHLDNDIRDLAKLTGRGFEEAIFMVHLIIKSIMQDVGTPCSISVQLTNEFLRDKWEKEFDRKFIQPTLGSINTEVQMQMEQVLNKKIGANNPLMRSVYQNDENKLDTKLPNFWCCRNPISLEHFSQNFNTADFTRKEVFPLINKLLREGSSLFSTRYLPDIVELQLRLKNKFGHCLDISKITNISIEEFEKQLNKDEAKEYKKLIGSVKKVWSRIGQEVVLKGRLDMKQHVVHSITPATSLAYLVPSTRGEGLLITALTDYLVVIHNSFVEVYKSIVNGCHNQEVLLREITSSHMIDYAENLQPLIISHAYYSIASNQEMNLFYDFEGIEKTLMTELVQSKPLIIGENLRFEYSREAYILGVFEKVRNKVEQIEIEHFLWKPIKADIDSEDAIDDVLIVLDVIISFLASAGGDPEDKLSYFLYKVLKYPQITSSLLYSRRAECKLQLKHVLSFWRYLNLEKARKQSINDQIPFSFLGDEFMENVNEKEKDQLEASCKHFNVEKILLCLQDFILFFAIGAKDNIHFGFKECVVEYAEENEWILPKGFSDDFPDNIKLSQCAAAWAILAQQEDRILNPDSPN